MLDFYSSSLEFIFIIILIPVFIFIIYDILKNLGKVYPKILKLKVNIIGNNTWNEPQAEIDKNTRYIELDFRIRFYNHCNNYNSIYNIYVYKKKRFKYYLLDNHHLNSVDTMKSISGTTSYEKIKYLNFNPYETKELHLKIKLTKEEYENIDKEPIYIKYKNKLRNKKIKLKKYIKNDKK